ncbi:general substrate transporter [Mycena sanguinolenta]|nr:general substrate transporter [Mycena sanguinolenta]
MHDPQYGETVVDCSTKKGTRDLHETLDTAASATGAAEIPSPTSGSFKLYLFLVVPSMCSMVVGYDVSVMNFVNGMEPYLMYFNLDGQDTGGGVGATTALIFGMYTIGTCLAVLVAGPICDHFGRRGGMLVGSLFCVVGGIVITVARNVEYLKAGRFLLGVATALFQVAVPLYSSEISPPHMRGRLTGICGAVALIATVISGAVATATGRLETSASWRIPLSLQIIPGAIALFFSYLIPESPRWLMSVGRKDEARLILSRYHSDGDDNAPLVILECKKLEQSIQLDATKKPWWDYVGLFRTRSDRYRTFLIFLMALCTQWAGSGLSYFLVVLLANDHISTQNLRLILSLVANIVSAIGAFCGAAILDKVGRRALWFWANTMCTVTLIISGVCTAKFSTDSHNPAGSNAAIAFLFLFNFFFCVAYIPLPGLYASECMSFENRANGVAFYTLVASLASLVNTYGMPIALAKIGWKWVFLACILVKSNDKRVYCVFIAWDVVSCVLIWIFAVETSGRTLEELNEIFLVRLLYFLTSFLTPCSGTAPCMRFYEAPPQKINSYKSRRNSWQ